MSPTLQAHKNY